MADVPANEKLWNMLVIQAKAKFQSWPSLPASKWVHQQYVQRGGRFISTQSAKTAKQARERVAKKKAAPAKKKDAKS